MRNIVARTKLYIVVLLAALAVVVWGLVLGSRPVSGDKTPVRVMIAERSPARSIATTLSAAGLIRSPFIFLLTCSMSGSSGKLKSGVYEFSRAMDTPTIIKLLVEGNALESWVTIPEGKTLREIADVLQAKQLADPGTFLQLTTSGGDQFPTYTFTYDDDLEGYLFPDTYLIKRGTSPDGVVERMLGTFEKKVVNRYRDEIDRFASKRLKLGEDGFNEGLHRILIVASLVEREAKVPADRPKIAAVIWNRLAKKMKLEVDATVTYQLGQSRANKPKVYYKDLQKDTPFNTYLHAGLPPAPICNPGRASIRAAMEPASTDDLYYVARPDGSHVFSKTLQEHDAAKKAIQDGKL